MTRFRIRTASRLHFGLFGWGEFAHRQFGGLGLMTTDPGLEVTAEPSAQWEATGPLAERTLAVATSVASQLAERGLKIEPARFQNVRVPEPHIGLGVGTQLNLAVTRLVTEMAGLSLVSIEELATLAGRGLRSGVGLHGFDAGGLIVDAGRRSVGQIPTRIVRAHFPDDWKVLVVMPENGSGLHGGNEVSAFRSLPRIPDGLTDRLCGLVLLGVLPAVIEHDLASFGKALEAIQNCVGQVFAPVQGGRFARPEAEDMVRQMREHGLQGVGQSSWGPTLYGFSNRSEQENARIQDLLVSRLGLSPRRLLWTTPRHVGATVETF